MMRFIPMIDNLESRISLSKVGVRPPVLQPSDPTVPVPNPNPPSEPTPPPESDPGPFPGTDPPIVYPPPPLGGPVGPA